MALMGVKRFGLVQRPSRVIPTPETCVPKAWRWQKFSPFCGSMRCHRTIGTLLIKTGLRGEVSEPPHLRQRPGEVPSRSLHRGSPQTCTPTCHQVTTRPGAWQWPQEGELSVQGMWMVSLQLVSVKPIAFLLSVFLFLSYLLPLHGI